MSSPFRRYRTWGKSREVKSCAGYGVRNQAGVCNKITDKPENLQPELSAMRARAHPRGGPARSPASLNIQESLTLQASLHLKGSLTVSKQAGSKLPTLLAFRRAYFIGRCQGQALRARKRGLDIDADGEDRRARKPAEPCTKHTTPKLKNPPAPAE